MFVILIVIRPLGIYFVFFVSIIAKEITTILKILAFVEYLILN